MGVQSPMEQTRSIRSHMGTSGRVEEGVSPPARELAESRDVIHFKWGRFVIPAFLAPNKSPAKSRVFSKPFR
jgi:hypothetical protein